MNKIKRGNIGIRNKKKLYCLINNLSIRTEKQKKRFLLYYGLIPNNTPIALTEIAHIENCSPSAVQCSVIKVRNNIARISGEPKELLKKIILESREEKS